MGSVASVWLLLALLMSAFAWMASRRLVALSLPLSAALAAFAVFVPLGKPKPMRPPHGQYVILGVDIIKDVAIKVLLKGADGVSTFYQLPYSNKEASEIQDGQDDARAEGGTPQLTISGDGESTVGVQGKPEQHKPAETPATSIQ